MNALIKSSMLLLPAAAIAVYLYAIAGDEGFEAVRSQPQDAICKQDGERLARFQAKPSLDEGLRFGSEIRCLQLWPQLQTIVDGLGNPLRSTALTGLNRAASDLISSSDAASTTASPASDDACTHDEDRLAELQAHPSINAAIRFDSDVKCPRLQPQLLAILDQLSHAAGSVQAARRKAPAPDTMSASEAPPSASPPPAEASATPDDACKRDEDRLAELQAKPSLDEALRFEDELKCSKLQPQLLALLDSLSQAPQSARALTPNGAARNTTSAPPASKSPGSEATSATSVEACKRDEDRLAELQANPTVDKATRLAREFTCIKLVPQLLAILDSLRHAGEAAPPSGPTGAGTISAGEAAPPASQPLTSETKSATSDDACKQDEDHLARFAELSCEKLRPQLPALTGELATPSPADAGSVSKGTGTSTPNDAPPSEAATDSGEAAQAIDTASPPAKPAPKAASETAGVAQPLTPNLDLPAKPSGKSSARVVVTRTDMTTSSAAETPSRPVQLGTPVKSEKAARVSPKAPQAAAEPQAVPPAPHAFAQRSINPLASALARVFGELVGGMGVTAGWAVQLAAPKSETEAKSDVARLNAKYASVLNGSAIGVQKAQVNGATVYRLRVGGLSKAEAVAICGRVKGGGGDCFIAKATASLPSKGGRRALGAKMGRYGLSAVVP